MMIFLGLIGLLFFVHFELAKKLHHAFQGMNLKWINIESDKLKDWFLPSLGLGFLSMEPFHNFEIQSSLWRAQVWGLRRYLFSISQTHYGFFFLFLILVSFLEINSLFFISLLVSVWVGLMTIGSVAKNVFWLKTSRQAVEVGLYFLLVLYIFEQVFKLTNILLPFMEESGLVFFLTDSNWLHFATLLTGAFFLSFVIPISGYSFYLSFFLYVNSQISYLGFVSIVMGEMLSYYLKMFLAYRKMDTLYYLQVKGLFKYLALAAGICFAVLYILKHELQIFQSYGDVGSQKWFFIATSLFIIFCFYLTFMIWGHFNFQRQQKDPDVKVTDGKLELESLKVSAPMVHEYLYRVLDLRLKKLREFQLELDEENKKKIPLFVLKKFDNEKEILSKLLNI